MFPKRILAPGFLTAMNLFLGFYAIIIASSVDFSDPVDVKNKFVTASWLIILAAIFDAFDGKVARATKGFSKFGVEFDSLADVISFGLAPSFLLYQVHLSAKGAAGIIISFFPLIFGAIRLARFNVEVATPEKVNFKGLPIPAAAVTVTSFIIFNFNLWNELWIPSLIFPLAILVSILMVSTLEFDTLPKFNFKSGRKNSTYFVILLSGVFLIVFFPEKATFPLVASYIIYTAIRSLLRLGKDGNGNRRKRRGRIFKKVPHEHRQITP